MDVTQRRAAWSAAWGVVALLLGGGAVPTWMEAVAPGSKFPIWPSWILTVLMAAAVFMCFASLSGRRATHRGGQQASSGKPHKPSSVDLIPEQVGDRLRLGLTNHGSAAEFSAQVTGILDPMRRMIGPQHWPIPWLEDKSAEPKRILAGQTRMLDFARYDAIAVNAELSTRHNDADHWWFSSVPTAIGAKYYNLRCQGDLAEQHFVLTVRIMNANSGKYLDWRLTVGIQGSEFICKCATYQRV